MRNRFSKYVFTVIAISALSLIGSAAYGQDRNSDHGSDHHQGLVQDWSGHHVNYSRMGPRDSIIAAQRDVRALDSWAASIRKDPTRWHFGQRVSSGTTQHRDWSISLGGGSINATMYPAKYTFDPNATPNCSTDFIVYPVNIAGSATQPNIVAFNNLYSGTTPAIGICNRGTPPAGDSGTAATVIWSYDINAIGGTVPISPTVSLDGSKVVFVESAAGVPAHFHVLAGKTGDGVDTTTPNAQNVLIPKVITSFSSNAPAAGSGAVTDLTLGSTAADTNTLSSPFIDYAFDYAYVGNDNGTLFRVTHVFCTQDPACSGGTPPAPSLDASWGTAGALSVCPGFKMTGPVKDGVSGNIFVGCSDGKLYGITTSGGTVTTFPVTVGDGTATGGVVDPPMVDSVNGWVYATAGSSSGGTAVLVQASTTGASAARTATLGAGGQFNVHAPAFNDAYFASGTSSSWLMYAYSVDTGNTTDELFGVTFTGSHLMNTGAPANTLLSPGSTKVEFSPLTEFFNAGNDQLFVSTLISANPNFIEVPITTFPLTYGGAVGVQETGAGTSGIVVDNASGDSQASSVYFGTIGGGNTAVKLTQSGLN